MAYADPEEVPEEELGDLNKDLAQRRQMTRQDSAVALRIAGAPYSEIARTLEYSSATQARIAVERALANTVGNESREQLRFLEARRLERLLRGLWKKATDPAQEEHLAAARTALAVIDRHSKLYGLDAPTEMVVYTPAASELEAWVSRMAQQVRGELPEEADIIGEVLEVRDEGTGDD